MPPPMHIVTTTIFHAAPLALDQRVTGEPRARHAVRMPDGDRAAVDIEPIVGNAQLVAAVDDLHRERLVQLPQADVVDLHAGAREQLRHGEDRSDAHFVGLAAGDGEAAEYAQRLEAATGGELVAHDHAGGRAVGELAGVAGGDDAARQRGLDPRHRFVGRVGADALVGRQASSRA